MILHHPMNIQIWDGLILMTNMKKIILLIFILISFMCSSTQIVTAQSEEYYQRNGMSIIHVSYTGEYYPKVNNYYHNNFQLDSRYNSNNIKTKIYKRYEKGYFKTSNSYYSRYITNNIDQFLKDEQVAKQIISYIFNRQEDGTMDLNRIHQRGLYNANDQDYKNAILIKRGIAALKDAGEKLVDKSYVAVLDHTNIRYEFVKDYNSENGSYYYKANNVIYLYKIQWNDTLLNKIWDCWIDKNTPIEERESKKIAFDKIDFSLQFVTLIDNGTTAVNTEIEKESKLVNLLNSDKVKKEKAFDKLMKIMINDNKSSIENKISALKLRVPICDISPIRAKIGTKEGLKTDNTFFAYEYQINSEGKEFKRNIGVVMATDKITNNSEITTGSQNSSEFYQFSGSNIEPGLSLVEKKLMHLTAEFGFATKEGLHLGLEYNKYAGTHTQFFAIINGNLSMTGANAGIQLGYGLRTNNFQLYPLIGISYDTILGNNTGNLSNSEKKENRAILGKIGMKTNLNIKFPFQIFAQLSYNTILNETYIYSIYKMEGTDTYRDVTGMDLQIGIRYCF
ncbi:MAG: hypothetical protein WC140_02790 [Bacteroidales bacterium]